MMVSLSVFHPLKDLRLEAKQLRSTTFFGGIWGRERIVSKKIDSESYRNRTMNRRKVPVPVALFTSMQRRQPPRPTKFVIIPNIKQSEGEKLNETLLSEQSPINTIILLVPCVRHYTTTIPSEPCNNTYSSQTL